VSAPTSLAIPGPTAPEAEAAAERQTARADMHGFYRRRGQAAAARDAEIAALALEAGATADATDASDQ
jgi:hypothetical protein